MRAATILLLSVCASASAAVLLDRIAVTIGNDVVTEGEIYDEIRITSFINGDRLDFSPAARRRAAERLVDQALIRREMNISSYPQPEASESQKILQQLKQKRFHGDDSAYRAALEQYGVSDEQVKAHVLWQLTALRFTDYRFLPGAPEPTQATHEHLEKKSQQRASAEARVPPKPTPRTDGESESAVPPGVDQELDAWLKQARSTTQIDFRQEAFQ